MFKEPLDFASTMMPYCLSKGSPKNVIAYITAHFFKKLWRESLAFEVFESFFKILLRSKILNNFGMKV